MGDKCFIPAHGKGKSFTAEKSSQVRLYSNTSKVLLLFHYDEGKEELLLNPKPDIKAAARDFGIDLSLTIERLPLPPEKRLRLMDEIRDGLKHMKAHGRFLTTYERY